MLKLTLYILSSIIDFLILIKYTEIFIQPKIAIFKYKKPVYLTAFLLILTFLVNYRIKSYLFTLFYVLVIFIVLIKFYNGKLWLKLFIVISEPLIVGLIGMLMEVLIYHVIGLPYPSAGSDLIYSGLRTFAVYTIFYTFFTFIDVLVKQKVKTFKNPYTITITGIITINISFLINVVIYYRLADFSQSSFEHLIVLILIGVLMIIFCSAVLYNNLIKHLQSEYNAKMQLHLNELQRDFYEKITASSQTLKSVRHDLKNHLIVLDGYLSKNKIEEAKAYIHEITGLTKDADMVINTNNIVLSSVLTQKKSACMHKGISFTYNINLGQHFISDSDLCIIISNILDNAIEASEHVMDNKGYIELEIDDSNEILSIRCVNNYVHEPVMHNGKFRSSKGNSIFHGIGLLNIETIVKKYDGVIIHNFENHIFSIDILLKF